MEFVHIAGNCVQSHVLVQMIKPADIPEEVVLVQQSGQFITLRVMDQFTILRQLDTLGNSGFDDLNIRIWFRDEIHCADSQTVQLRILINR